MPGLALLPAYLYLSD
ncbi:uncharacterized protein FRV6_14229 [Fusarium oxysporum]|uniref:Uncharacterized protein n=1 Tax=Fusarium oxysporum TaxID=5507 RepID=A0A2H3TWJ4_FUSOX|nr:uncharacterized protein FRV6_14229 [Fusarium oxysporum]